MDFFLARPVSRRLWLAHCSLLAANASVPCAWAAGSPASSAAASRTAGAATAGPLILILGDSLSAEYGLSRGSGWVALLERRLAEQKTPARVVNASISGETSSGGRSRLPALLATHKPGLVVFELGANDALRGLPLAGTRGNLAQMVRAAQAAGAKVLICGIQVPPNYGQTYSRQFAALFAEVASAEKAALVPFLLAGVADRADYPRWFQPDQIHPVAQAHPIILNNVWPALQVLLR
jgi:acyl-CoA thioesterase-1